MAVWTEQNPGDNADRWRHNTLYLYRLLIAQFVVYAFIFHVLLNLWLCVNDLFMTYWHITMKILFQLEGTQSLNPRRIDVP